MKPMAWSLLAFALMGCTATENTASTNATTPSETQPTAMNENKNAEPEQDRTTPPDSDTTSAVIGEKSELRDAVPLPGEEVAVIETKMGRIVFRFFTDKAPKHVASFKKLAKDKFYDGTTFHRVIPGFMIQGGDPNTKGTDRSKYGQGGPGFNLDSEFNEISHVRGIISMARASDPNSAGSQFFVVHGDSAFLDTQYTVWGQVVKSGKEAEGKESEYLQTVDKIVNIPNEGQASGNLAKERVEMKVSVQKWPLKD